MRRRIDPESSMWDWLTHDLQFLCRKYDLSYAELGRLLQRSRQNVSNIMAGRRQIKEKDADIIDTRYDTGGHFGRVLSWARRGHSPDWFEQYTEREIVASVVKTYEALAIPALFQTPEYARTLVAASGEENVEELFARRMDRQSILTRDNPPMVWAIISQNAIDWPVGGADAMRKQLAHLLELSESPSVGMRVLPRSSGGHAGFDGSFCLFSGEDGNAAYVEAPGGGRLILSPAEIRSFGLLYDRVGQSALPESLSRELIQKGMEEL